MATRLTPIGLFFKWVVVPGAIFAVGYFALGPRLGHVKDSQPASVEQAEPPTQTVSSVPGAGQSIIDPSRPVVENSPLETVHASVPPSSSAPSVTVSARPVTPPDETPPKPKPKRRRRRHPKPKPEVTQGAAQDAEPPSGTGQAPPPTTTGTTDGGGSGGATTAGTG